MSLQLNDVGMTEKFEILNLSSNLAHNIQIFNLLAIENFYSNFMASQLMFTNCKQQSF